MIALREIAVPADPKERKTRTLIDISESQDKTIRSRGRTRLFRRTLSTEIPSWKMSSIFITLSFVCSSFQCPRVTLVSKAKSQSASLCVAPFLVAR